MGILKNEINKKMATKFKLLRLCMPKMKYFNFRLFSNSPSDEIHPFKVKLTNSSVLDHLSNNILYKDDDMVVFNKPANVGKSKPAGNAENSRFEETVYISNLMKDISKLVPDFEDLKVIKFPERYTSGVMIFAGSEKSALKLEKIKRRAKGGVELCDTYLAITHGTPIRMKDACKLSVKFEANKNNNKLVPIINESWSKTEMKKQKIKLFRISHTVLSEGPMASLTEVSPSTTAKNAVRLYFATKLLSPILGDAIFSSRIQNLMGVPMLIDPWSDVANSFKRLPNELLEALRLSHNETSLVPLFLHLSEVRLPGYSKGQDLVLQAPPPTDFLWACEQLSLNLQPDQVLPSAIEAG